MRHSPQPLVKIKNVSKFYSCGKKQLCALHDITLEIFSGTTLGVVGESGCGKSTLGRVMLKLEEATKGQIFFNDKPISTFSNKQMQPLRRSMQMIFQDPYSSLNPRFTIEQIIGEGIEIHNLASGEAKKEIIAKLVSDVGLDPQILQRYPHEFSGGQKQRIGIARALAVDPQFLVCDEPLSALDTCTQKQVMELLLRFQRERHLTYMFISHDLHAVRSIADRVAVMYLGHLVELAPVQRIFSSPLHPYTQALIDAIPIADPIKERSRKRLMIYGEAPSPLNPPKGCPFHPRCPKAMPVCSEIAPILREAQPSHFVACHLKT
ncbi:MAG TPA: ABC transporter ATP-binding protein [Parachlamydiaceae bacterium]|nr:ABC transporter ATP-binding protein [Parachlamydiaceae bacterium]